MLPAPVAPVVAAPPPPAPPVATPGSCLKTGVTTGMGGIEPTKREGGFDLRAVCVDGLAVVEDGLYVLEGFIDRDG